MSELQCVKFGDMAQQITTKVNPKDTSLETYVGLEHLDTGSLRINRRGTPHDVIGEKLRVCKGDIIFGKRRVYQRKIAIADFDGICSAHAMVLRPKDDIIDKEFFPFFMQSDLFMERALQISVGSLSPTINWKTLAEQEFSIPLLPEQRLIATTLWAAEDCIVKGERFVVAAEWAKQVLIGEFLTRGIGNKSFKTTTIGNIPDIWKLVTISEIVKKEKGSVKFGPFGSQLKKEELSKSGIKVYGQENLINKNWHLGERRINLKKYEQLKSCELIPGDFVISMMGTIGKCSIFPDNFEKGIMDSHLLRLQLNLEILDPRFFSQIFEGYNKIQTQIINSSHGGTMPGLNSKMIKELVIPLPPLPEQRQIAAILTRCDEMIAATRANVGAAKALKMKMINVMLGSENITS